ncbi:redoxin domain-containing protein [Tautonia sociabilis]|uniref:Redoxin domain-containing protein n=1 Tax=Tautonia sociabilis TaxID=2080755 RepID=A0A432MJW7_9BACT|nr:redoxin domain-containing protein [Tautonia sociabilis]RUL87416.1 redoxin domain-containing protein [Tautonia sociabilis]
MTLRLLRWALSALAIAPILAPATLPTATADDEVLGRGIGDRVADFRLPDARTGEEVSLYQFRGKKAAVIVFTGIDCPIGDLYMPRLVRLADRFESEGVVFLAINSNRNQSAGEIAAQAEEFGLPFPVLKDEGNAVADQLLAERTCEVLVLDAKAVLRYRGAIDDQYGLGFAKDAPERHFLADAIEAVLAGRSPETTASSVVGCPIERDQARRSVTDLMDLDIDARVNRLIAAADRIRAPGPQLEAAWAEVAPDADALIDQVGPVTYAKEVAPILRARCESCHRPGEVGPFPLTNYEEVSRRTAGIQEVVDLRRMPPWHADPRFPEGRHFANDRSLTPTERAILLSWIEQGAPEGDPADLPPPASYPDGWTIGEPDLVIEMPAPYTVKAEGVERYQRFRVPLNFDRDVWVQAAEARPTDRSVVHHIIGYIIPPGGERGGRDRIHLCGYAPGDMPTVYPPGTAKRIPAGSELLFELHYTPVGKVKVDRSKIGLVLARHPVEREAVTIGIANGRFQIPPGAGPDARDEAANYPVRSRFVFPRDAELIAFMPHMHLRGKSFRYEATYADGTSEILLDVPAYDFNWQSYYYLAQPISFRAGERLDCLAHFDNSPNNPVNPDPSSPVSWGDQTWEEMMIGYIDVSFPLPPGDRPRLGPPDAVGEAE